MSNKQLLIQAAINRAETGTSTANYPAIFDGFEAKGIDPSQIRPRENVFTYNVWGAKGRQVMKGQKSVKVPTFVTGRGGELQRATACLFHISQTKPIGEPERTPLSEYDQQAEEWLEQDELQANDDPSSHNFGNAAW